MWSLIIVLVLCLNASVHTHWFEQGDLCETWKGTKGICRHYLNCPTAAEGVQENGPLEICNYEGIYPIVCCEFDNSVIRAPPISRTPDYSITGMTPNIFPFNRMRNNLILTKPDYTIPQPITQPITRPPVYAITLGTDAKLKEFPHMALLGYGEPDNIQWLCGGSLINKEFILTAAHCLRSRYGELRYIRLGEFDYSTTTDDTDPQNFAVRSTHPHPKYIPPSYYHDIALVRLDRPVRISDYVKPACLGLTKNVTKYTPIAMGWGATSAGGDLSTILQAGSLSFVSNEICRLIYGEGWNYRYGIIDQIQICADGGELPRDACEGDSGGPLQITNYRNSCLEIVGVTSFGKTCGLAAGVYTRVYPYTSWINAIVRSIE